MFRAAGHDEARVGRWFQTGVSGRPYFELWRANREQLEEAGVRAEQDFHGRLVHGWYPAVFHSYRAKGAGAGRMLGVIRAR